MTRWDYLVEGKLEDLPNVKRIVDTSNLARVELRKAGVARGNQIVSWHVSDDVSGLKQALSKGVSLMKAGGKSGDLGAGLYVSAIPHVWANRSADKWAFLSKLTKSQLSKLTDKLNAEMQKDTRLSANEKATASRTISYVKAGDYDVYSLLNFAGQQYGFKFWRPKWLSSIGITNDSKPMAVEVHLKGKFAELTRPSKDHRSLRRAGVSGAFIPTGFSSDAQMVVWNAKAVTYVGEPEEVK